MVKTKLIQKKLTDHIERKNQKSLIMTIIFTEFNNNSLLKNKTSFVRLREVSRSKEAFESLCPNKNQVMWVVPDINPIKTEI